MFRFIGSLLSPAGKRGRLSILIWQRALAAPDPVLHDEVDAATFEKHLALLIGVGAAHALLVWTATRTAVDQIAELFGLERLRGKYGRSKA